MDPVIGIITLVILVALYFLPSIIAKKTGHRQFLAILVANIIFGWTGLGWALLLVWSFMKEKA
ncbi:MAG: hypothetical protein [Caudoviricetes sp.]|nr:MAG: hypothetical protein [Caudoviricetes sp.]